MAKNLHTHERIVLPFHYRSVEGLWLDVSSVPTIRRHYSRYSKRLSGIKRELDHISHRLEGQSSLQHLKRNTEKFRTQRASSFSTFETPHISEPRHQPPPFEFSEPPRPPYFRSGRAYTDAFAEELSHMYAALELRMRREQVNYMQNLLVTIIFVILCAVSFSLYAYPHFRPYSYSRDFP